MGRFLRFATVSAPVLAAGLALAGVTGSTPAIALAAHSPAAHRSLVIRAGHAARLTAPAAASAGQLGWLPARHLRGSELVDETTGSVLWSKNPGTERPMGSVTKVMTALLVMRAGDLNQKITVSRGAVRYVRRDGASSAGLVRGDTFTARQLLNAMLIPSGCDAAYLLATAYGPGRMAFVATMNAMAQTLGMNHTHFSHYDGMPYPTEWSTYSTPADLIKLGEAAMRYPLFRRIVGRTSDWLPGTRAHHTYLWDNTNGLLVSYPGALGIKTGDTNAAGHCLLFEAVRNGQTLIGVVLHAMPAADPAAAIYRGAQILNWGFRHT